MATDLSTSIVPSSWRNREQAPAFHLEQPACRPLQRNDAISTKRCRLERSSSITASLSVLIMTADRRGMAMKKRWGLDYTPIVFSCVNIVVTAPTTVTTTSE